MKFALINAGLPDNSSACLRTTAYPPLSIVYLATYLKEKIPAIELIVIDDQFSNELPYRDLKDCDYVGISANSITYPRALEIACSIKKINSNLQIILGGIHASILPNQILSNQQCFDYLVKGQGEVALFEMFSGTPISNIPNLVYKDMHGEIKHNHSNFISIESRPIPDFSLINPSVYFRNFNKRYSNKSARKGIAFISSTGCQWRRKSGGCTFCSISNDPATRLTPSRFWDTIQSIKNSTGADFFWDVSDTFTSNKSWLSSVAASRPSDDSSSFHIYGRANDLLRPGVIENLKRIGVEEILVGIESLDDLILKKCNKGITVSQIFSALHCLNKARIKVAISLILGLPGECKRSITNTLESCEMIKDKFGIVEECHASIITPLPGSILYENLTKLPSTKNFYDKFDLLPLSKITKDYISHFTECSADQITSAYLTIDHMFPSAGPFYMDKNDPIYGQLGYAEAI